MRQPPSKGRMVMDAASDDTLASRVPGEGEPAPGPDESGAHEAVDDEETDENVSELEAAIQHGMLTPEDLKPCADALRNAAGSDEEVVLAGARELDALLKKLPAPNSKPEHEAGESSETERQEHATGEELTPE